MKKEIHNNTRAEKMDAHKRAIEILAETKAKQAKRKLKEVHIRDSHNTILIVSENKNDREVINNFEYQRKHFKY